LKHLKDKSRLRGFPGEAALSRQGNFIPPDLFMRNRLEVTPEHAMCPWEWESESITVTPPSTLTLVKPPVPSHRQLRMVRGTTFPNCRSQQ
jgi:hypothetical protein